MSILELVLLGIGLSFDTFAVSVSTGISLNRIKFLEAIRIALVLAFFQAAMPFVGWIGGKKVELLLAAYDHWVAFVLLAGLGVKVIIDSLYGKEEKKLNPMIPLVLITMALATSIDALVVGVSFAFILDKIVLALIFIGSITFLAAMLGMLIGKNTGKGIGKNVELAGGLILILIGLKILLQHLYL